jgi:hypothetical protein
MEQLSMDRGSSSVSGGLLTVDGARFNTDPETLSAGPGSSVELVATFAAVPFQHVGFGGGTDAAGFGGIFNGEAPWAMFSTGSGSGTALQARTYDGTSFKDFTIPGSFLGASHRYRIEWTPIQFDYFIDGQLVHTEPVAITSSMRAAVSDYNNDGQSLTVDWIHVSPYSGSGTLESRVFDGGRQTAWGTVSITAETPAGTTLTIDIRTGATPTPDGSWSAFKPISDGEDIDTASRYIQYRANLATTDGSITPVLQAVSISGCTACKLKADLTIQNVSCNGGKDGSIKVTPSNGTSPYFYRLGPNGDYQPGGADSTFSGLKAKAYVVYVKDANGCVKKIRTEITAPPAIVITPTIVNASCGGRDGSITVSAQGGSGSNYQYKRE